MLMIILYILFSIYHLYLLFTNIHFNLFVNDISAQSTQYILYSLLFEQFADDDFHHIVFEVRMQALPRHSLPAEPLGQQAQKHAVHVLGGAGRDQAARVWT